MTLHRTTRLQHPRCESSQNQLATCALPFQAELKIEHELATENPVLNMIFICELIGIRPSALISSAESLLK